MSRTDLLTPTDWAQFATQYPQATDYLLRLTLEREYTALAALPRRTPTQEARYNQLKQWREVRQEALSCAGTA